MFLVYTFQWIHLKQIILLFDLEMQIKYFFSLFILKIE